MTDEAAAELAAWGKVILLDTRGRVSGRARRTPVGFIDDGGDPPTYRVAASDDTSDWARNLLVDPRCHVLARETRRAYEATSLPAAERAATVAELILKYGTPSEGLGGGPAFRLTPRGGRPRG